MGSVDELLNTLTSNGAKTEITEPQKIADEIEQKRTDKDYTGLEETPPEAVPEAKPEAQAQPEAKEPIIDEDTLLAEVDAVEAPAAENFKKLRKKLSETNKTLKQIQDEKALIAKELEKHKSGEVIPEALQEKENEIARLRPFESLVSLKTSKEYQESFVKPLNEVTTKIKAIATDYGLPEEVMDEALNLTNKAELNRFLSEHFDDVGALEVKQLLGEANNIQTKIKAAEARPAQVLAQLQQEHQVTAQAQKARARSAIAETSKGAWVESLMSIRNEGKIPELTMKENDTEHNEKYVKPVLQAAAQEYGKLVNILAESGLENLTKDAAFALARMVQLAHASAVSIESRHAALEYADNIKRNATRNNGYIRPTIGSMNSGGSAPKAAPSSPKQAAEVLLDKVLSNRR